MLAGDYLKGDKYKIIKKISVGGMGIIYLATDSEDDEKVVLKTANIEGDDADDTKIEKLRVEAEILKRINHEHIVKYIDYFKEGDTLFLVCEYIEGENLTDMVKRDYFDENTTIKYTLQLLETLEYLHDYNLNIIHRDIKPDNIMVKDDSIILIDFGTAKAGFTSIPVSGHTKVYTPGYGAPEQQLGGRDVGPETDIYGVGTTMFYMLTGEEPRFNSIDTGYGLGIKRLKEVKLVNPNVSIFLNDIVYKATELESKDRFRTATEMKNALLGKKLSQTNENPEAILYVAGKAVSLGDTPLIIGREGDIKVDDKNSYVSRKHARIYKDESGQYWIEDLGSVNHTWVYVNGEYQRKDRWALQHGDKISLAYNDEKGPYLRLIFEMMR